RRAALKTPSDACVEDCRGKLIWPRCPINACSPWCVPIITLPESVLTTKPRQRFSAVTCCTSNVNPPSRFHGNDDETSRSVLEVRNANLAFPISGKSLPHDRATRQAKVGIDS